MALLTEMIKTAFNLARADNEILEKVTSKILGTEPNTKRPYPSIAVVSDTWVIC